MSNDFKPLSFWRELLLKDEELNKYYLQKRKYEYENRKLLKGINWRDKLHPILLSFIRLDRKYINKQNFTIIGDKRKKTDKPVIYAITHVGMYDYQIVSEAIRDHQYPFAGDPETMYRSTDGLVLALNGVVLCDTDSKEDRHIATEKSKELLRANENLLIYPEGIWNLSPNLLSLPLFPGIINMSLETGCDIIPVAVEQYGNEFYVNIGENFKLDNTQVSDKDNLKEYVNQKRQELREKFATLKWEIFESVPLEKRKNLGTYEEEYEKFINTRLNEWVDPKTKKPYYNKQILKKRTFREKNVDMAEDVYSYFQKVKINKNNAFMFRKDNSLPVSVQEEIEENLKKGR